MFAGPNIMDGAQRGTGGFAEPAYAFVGKKHGPFGVGP